MKKALRRLLILIILLLAIMYSSWGSRFLAKYNVQWPEHEIAFNLGNHAFSITMPGYSAIERSGGEVASFSIELPDSVRSSAPVLFITEKYHKALEMMETPVQEPNVAEIKRICELATLECQYNHVVKIEKLKRNILQNNSEVWIEYQGNVKIGTDINKVDLKVEGTEITVTLPSPRVLSLDIADGSLTEDSYYYSATKFNQVKITPEEKHESIKAAEEELRARVEGDSALMSVARKNTRSLIENYIDKLGEAFEVEYHITWVELPQK